MRISVITNWAYAATVVLTVLSGSAFILSATSANRERIAVEEHLALSDLAEGLALGAEERTDEARLYVMRDDISYLDAFQGKEAEERLRERSIKGIRDLGVAPIELQALDDVQKNADVLDRIEQEAIALYRKGDQAGARQALFGPEHERIQTALLSAVTRFRDLVNARTQAVMQDTQKRSDWWGFVAKTLLAVTAAVFLSVLYFILKRRIAMPLMRMTGIVTRLARQDYAVDVPLDRRRDEIGEMNEAIHIFRENGLERDRLDAERRRDQQTKDLILQMMHRLQACQAQDELAEVVALFAPQIFPDLAGNLYIMNESRSTLSRISSWHEPRRSEPVFPATACWGLRRGRPHASSREHGDISCQHLDHQDAMGLCVPLTAQGDVVGLLYFEERPQGHIQAEASRLYLELIAENIGLAAANLQLRDKLTNLSIRDALTGLYNRRSLDEDVNHHARDREMEQLCCMMIDIDHFKRFNDEFGHDAGDEVMRYVAQTIVDTIGEAGRAYRFGGEEFTVLLPGIGDAEGFDIAERLRSNIRGLPLSHRGRILGPISVSIGVGSLAEGAAVSTLLTRADAALLEAKAQGRNMTVMASVLLPDSKRRGSA
ncbi:sensor domain-containing diguanylate cyclase [Rhizobium metallidurans]|uniref:diguanylate cyclase n=1 Tax=Rhizobium metallidurans TaxID=1265931 RepID=A0A7W6CNY2_9HYPH|nr:sensor domain-containing diguanylate cyclase [Rhizobium metallidurans]MBB3964532.1 diguanylate cyclase (GGDEF)-like protein [Rhizobium metallidurans]